MPPVFTPKFYDKTNKERQWTAFCVKNATYMARTEFNSVIENTEDFSRSRCGSCAQDSFVLATVEARGAGRGIGPQT
jgi:hypothetical protein